VVSRNAITDAENCVFRVSTKIWIICTGMVLNPWVRGSACRFWGLSSCTVVCNPRKTVPKAITGDLPLTPANHKWDSGDGIHMVARLNETFASVAEPTPFEPLVEALNICGA
jgi:hypothetical protein